MNIADIKEYDVANGQGVRLSVFVSGCPHHCKGCFNEETWDYNYGAPFTEETITDITHILENHIDIYDGITILGGEPLCQENISVVSKLVSEIISKFPILTIWIYTGYTLEEISKLYESSPDKSSALHSILRSIDILVDGRFVESKKSLKLKFRGSSNQRIINVPETIKRKQIVLSDLMNLESPTGMDELKSSLEY